MQESGAQRSNLVVNPASNLVVDSVHRAEAEPRSGPDRVDQMIKNVMAKVKRSNVKLAAPGNQIQDVGDLKHHNLLNKVRPY